MIEVKYEPEFEPTNFIPYLTLTGELWDVFSENLGENWLRYNGTQVYNFQTLISFAGYYFQISAAFWKKQNHSKCNCYQTKAIFTDLKHGKLS